MNTRLQMIRKSLKLSQEEFGKKIELSKPSISALENGTREITDRTIKLICNEFNVNENWIRTGEGEMFVKDESKDLFFTLGEKYKTMDEMDIKIISEYLKLSPDERDVFKNFFRRICE